MYRTGCPQKALALTILSSIYLGACSSIDSQVVKEDPYVLYREHMPRSILILPPANESINVDAPYSWLSTATRPVAEHGYYVFPVAVVDEFMKDNGLPAPEDMHSVPLDKIAEVFGADAVLYVTLGEYGQKFELLSSVTRINAHAELVDVQSGLVLWTGDVAYSRSSSNNSGGGLLGTILSAAISQVGASVTDAPHQQAPFANQQLFNSRNGLLLGPLHPSYEAAVTEAEAAVADAEPASTSMATEQ